MNEQLIQRIQELIRKLQEQRAQMAGGTQTAAAYEKMIAGLSTEMQRLASGAAQSGRQIDSLTAKLDRFYQAVARRQAHGFSFGGQSVNARDLGPLSERFLADEVAAESKAPAANPYMQRGNDDPIDRIIQKGLAGNKKSARRLINEKKQEFAETYKALNELSRQYVNDLRDYNKALASGASQNELQPLINKLAEDNKALTSALAKAEALEKQYNDLRGQGKIAPKTDRVQIKASNAEDRLLNEQERAEKKRLKAIEDSQKEEIRLRQLGEQAMDKYDQGLARYANQEMRRQEQAKNQEKRILDEQIKLVEQYNKKREEILQRRIAKEEALNARLNLADTLPGGRQAAEALNRRAQGVDPQFTPETIKRVDTQPGGFTRVNYQIKTAEGVFKSATFVVDKFGNVLTDTQRRFRSFGDAIARDIVEFTKWSLAVAVVLGPLQQLAILTQDTIANESKLADVTISLGNAQRSTNEIFEAAYQIAQQTSEGIDGVLEAYNAAYRATGGIADEQERFIATNKLLTDAIVLSKLSALDQAGAIDTLAAALKQAGYSLDEGQILLNKWVAVSRVANVDLETLATGFSIVGDAAANAGLEADELNGVIALIAETSGKSASEVGNTIRRLVAGLQGDTAEQVLAGYGISTKSNGIAKDFLTILGEIAETRKIMSKDDFNKLAATIGGGARGQSDFSALVSSYDKIAVVADASRQANETTGESLGAVATKTELVESAVTRLGNAFRDLGVALGEDGGMLDSFRMLVDFMTKLVSGFSDLTSALGKAGPILYTTLASLAILRYNKLGERITTGISEFATGLDKTPNMTSWAGGYPLRPGGGGMIGRAGNFLAGNAGYIAAGAAGLAPALGNALAGEGEKAWTNIGGAILGGVLGSSGGPTGIAIGATLGSAIAEGLYTAVVDYKPEFSNLFNETITPKGTPTEEPTTQAGLEEQALKRLFDTAGGGAGSLFGQGLLNAGGWLRSRFTGDTYNGLEQEDVVLMRLEGMRNAGRISDQEYQEIIQQLQEARKQPAAVEAANQLAEEQANADAPILNKVIDRYSRELLNQRIDGNLGAASYRRGLESVEGLGAYATNLYNTVGEGQDKETFYNRIGRIRAFASQEEITELTTMMGDINDPNTSLERRNELIKEANNLIGNLNQKLLAQAELFRRVSFSEYNANEFGIIREEALKVYGDIESASISAGKVSQEEADAIRGAWEEYVVVLKDGQTILEKLPSDYLKLGEEAAKAASKLQDNLSFSAGDYTRENIEFATGGAYDNLAKQLEGLGYKQDLSDEIFITKNDELIKVNQKDMKIVQYLLQQIEENTSQLDGMYNLPDGATFYAPVGALGIRPTLGGGAGSTPETTALKQATTDVASSLFDFATFMQQLAEEGSSYADTHKADKYPNFDETAFMTDLLENANMYPEQYKAEYKPDFAQQRAAGNLPGYASGNLYNNDFSAMRAAGNMPGYASGTIDPNQNDFAHQRAAGYLPGYQSGIVEQVVQTYTSDLMGLFRSGERESLDFMNWLPSQDFNAPEQFTATGKTTIPDIASMFSSLITNLSTKLNLNLNSVVTLQVDGRQMAQVVKTYLKNDLVRYSSGGGGSRTVNMI